MKKPLIAVVAVFVAWSVLDFVLHQLILGSTYQETAALWRPMAEMKMGLMYLVVLISATCFVYIYSQFIAEKSVGTGIRYGLVFGIVTGISMGYGTYSVMPIPYILALSWFLGTVVESVVAGLLLGLIVKD